MGRAGNLSHVSSSMWRFHYLSVTGNNGHMVNVAAFRKEHQISRLGLGVGHMMAVRVVILSGGKSSDLLVRSMVHCILRKTGAIETDRVGALLDTS